MAADVELAIASMGGIRNYPKDHPTKDELHEGYQLIEKLQYPQLFKMGKIFNAKTVRLDGQRSPGGGRGNLQIQINDEERSPQGGTTLGGVILANELRDFGATDQGDARKLIMVKVKEAFKKSLASKANFAVNVKK
jgi:hypothetical protein